MSRNGIGMFLIQHSSRVSSAPLMISISSAIAVPLKL
jgi:hypothetical protein